MILDLVVLGVGISVWISDLLTAVLVALLLFEHKRLPSFLSVRRRHSEREDLQAVHEEAAGGRETEDPPGQRTQVHVHFPPSTHLLFSLQRVHLVRKSSKDKSLPPARLSVWTVNWV